ncbi:MAG: hypothetical protein AAGA08_17525 [Pseudomonadota bacterium]
MLRAIGQAHRVTASGSLPRLGVAPSPPWDGYTRQITAELCRSLGPNLLSVALRGSTVRATAVIGVSDLDLVIVTQKAVMDVAVPHIIAAPDLEVETALATDQQLRSDPAFSWLRHNLTFCGFTVWGHDYLRDLPDPKLDDSAFAHVKAVEKWLKGWIDMMAAAPNDKERKAICTWLMKRVVRTLFESIMLEDGSYTRDIYPCADVASRYYPSLRAEIFAAAELAVTPSPDPKVIEAALAPLHNTLMAAQSTYKGQVAV